MKEGMLGDFKITDKTRAVVTAVWRIKKPDG